MPIYLLINNLFRVAEFLIIARVVISWVPRLAYHPVGRWIIQLVDPCLRPLRRLLPPWKTGGLDLSPLIALILLDILRQVVFRSIILR